MHSDLRHIEFSVFTRYGNESSVLSPKEIVDFAVKDGAPAIAIADFDTVWGLPELSCYARKAGLKPLYGLQFPVSYDYCREKVFTAFARNRIGLQVLHQILTEIRINENCGQSGIDDLRFDRLKEDLLLGRSLSVYDLLSLFREYRKTGDLSSAADFAESCDFLALEPPEPAGASTLKDDEKADFSLFMKKLAVLGPRVIAVSAANSITELDGLCHRIMEENRCFTIEEDPMSPHFMLTTEQLLTAWSSLLDVETAWQFVVTNPNLLADEIADTPLFPRESPDSYRLKDAGKLLQERSRSLAQKKYGDPLPLQVEERLSDELSKIGNTENASYILLLEKLVNRLNEAGIPHITRGWAGGSLIVCLLGITEIDPLPLKLPAEYSFGVNGERRFSLDLAVPEERLFEVRQILEEETAPGQLFVAGVRVGDPEKAKELLRKKEQTSGITLDPAAHDRVLQLLTGAYGTVQEKPFLSVLYLPEEDAIERYTAVRPGQTADDLPLTEYCGYELPLQSMNVLGDRSLSMLVKLESMTGRPFSDITPDFAIIAEEPDLWSLPDLPEDLRAAPELLCRVPQSYGDLITAFGLRHGTGVSFAAHKYFMTEKGISSEAPAFREDVFRCLLDHGLPVSVAFSLAEAVRRGRAKDITPEQQKQLKEHAVPDHYVKAMQDIRYLFPRVHAMELVNRELRLLWYRRHFPDQFNQVMKELDEKA